MELLNVIAQEKRMFRISQSPLRFSGIGVESFLGRFWVREGFSSMAIFLVNAQKKLHHLDKVSLIYFELVTPKTHRSEYPCLEEHWG